MPDGRDSHVPLAEQIRQFRMIEVSTMAHELKGELWREKRDE